MADDPAQSNDARQLVDQILNRALRQRASDVHVEPTGDGYDVKYRIDGLLHTVGQHDATVGRTIVSRLMVMGQLLTYRLDIPQEGRLRVMLAGEGAMEMRLAIIPTSQGIRAAVRLPAELIQPRTLHQLDLPPTLYEGLIRFARGDAGMLVMAGPAGSGKTTTIYALLQKIVELSPGLSIICLEDPVERNVPGVTQIEVSAFGEMTYERALKSILRQDPQVLMLGEIRDAATASLAVQAALSGHRLICTLHAASPAGAIARLFEMGLEPYQITSALFGVVAQRLLRRTTGSGEYQGRIPAAELVVMDEALRKAVLDRADADRLRKSYEPQAAYVSMRVVADDLVLRGLTDATEVRRVFGEG
jgi:type II secretory ATPase GspE/PulE/Tfp pilus assembly ATPase PilB-like protein